MVSLTLVFTSGFSLSCLKYPSLCLFKCYSSFNTQLKPLPLGSLFLSTLVDIDPHKEITDTGQDSCWLFPHTATFSSPNGEWLKFFLYIWGQMEPCYYHPWPCLSLISWSPNGSKWTSSYLWILLSCNGTCHEWWRKHPTCLHLCDQAILWILKFKPSVNIKRFGIVISSGGDRLLQSVSSFNQ